MMSDAVYWLLLLALIPPALGLSAWAVAYGWSSGTYAAAIQNHRMMCSEAENDAALQEQLRVMREINRGAGRNQE